MSAHVLLVDDKKVIRDVLAAWLGDHGYECAEAGSVEEALACAAERSFDVALVDTHLPDGDAVALANQLRATDSELGVVMVTGASQTTAIQANATATGTEYLLKPFTRQELVDAVDRAIKKRATAKPPVAGSSQEKRARLEEVIAQRTRDLSQQVGAADTSTMAALETLLVALCRRNPDAVAHARRVAGIAAALASDLGLSDTEQLVVERGALLHDIGKLVMPAELMCAPTALTRGEIDLIRTHPQAAYKILSAAPMLRLPAEIVVASHEAWDGSGYPRRLAGAAIPIGSRIVALADTYDALTWSRVLGEPVSPVRAAAELVRASGTYFDPHIVHAWLRRLDSSDSLDDELPGHLLVAREWDAPLQAL